jgi:hypothetical protein
MGDPFPRTEIIAIDFFVRRRRLSSNGKERTADNVHGIIVPLAGAAFISVHVWHLST